MITVTLTKGALSVYILFVIIVLISLGLSLTTFIRYESNSTVPASLLPQPASGVVFQELIGMTNITTTFKTVSRINQTEHFGQGNGFTLYQIQNEASIGKPTQTAICSGFMVYNSGDNDDYFSYGVENGSEAYAIGSSLIKSKQYTTVLAGNAIVNKTYSLVCWVGTNNFSVSFTVIQTSEKNASKLKAIKGTTTNDTFGPTAGLIYPSELNPRSTSALFYPITSFYTTNNQTSIVYANSSSTAKNLSVFIDNVLFYQFSVPAPVHPYQVSIFSALPLISLNINETLSFTVDDEDDTGIQSIYFPIIEYYQQ
jgi:hypothetical protein